MDTLKHSRYETQTEVTALKAVLNWFDGFRQLSISREVWLQCQLALIEGFTNVVRHAHKGLPRETPVEIEVAVTTDSLEIWIWDRGPGFDLQDMLDRKLQTTTPDSEGGRGLRIMARVADKIAYTQVDTERNCLYLKKSFVPAAGSELG